MGFVFIADSDGKLQPVHASQLPVLNPDPVAMYRDATFEWPPVYWPEVLEWMRNSHRLLTSSKPVPELVQSEQKENQTQDEVDHLKNPALDEHGYHIVDHEQDDYENQNGD